MDEIVEALIEVETEDDFYSNDDLYNINSWGADLSFRELILMYDDDELIKPELQRKYVWDKTEASRFIESLLMGLPVPSIFLAKIQGDRKLIIDGYQRIMTVYDYVKKGIFSKNGKVFKLSNSKVINERWRGKSFKELDQDEQRRIKSTTIHAIIFEQKLPKDDTSLYQIFERINTSGRTLTAQEIRNCIYQGTFNDLLFNLNQYAKWRCLFGNDEEDSRMKDIEFILRFFALRSDNIKNSTLKQISLKKYLNEFMGNLKNADEDIISKERTIFIKTIDFLYNNLGESSFHNISSNSEELVSRFHPTVFDAISIATAYMIENTNELKFDNLNEKRFTLLNDVEFQKFTSERTTNIENIKGRISLALKYLYGIKYE